MARIRQTYRKTTTRKKTRKSKTRNCPTCGRFMKK